MNASAIVQAARADGVRLTLCPSGALKAIGDGEAVNRWLPSLRANKAELLAALASQAADEAEDLREFFDESAGIMEHDAGLPRPEAQIEAARMTATLARNRKYLWASLRAALARYPELLALVPDQPGQVDSLALGAAKVAVLVGRRVVWQGLFSAEHEVRVYDGWHREPATHFERFRPPGNRGSSRPDRRRQPVRRAHHATPSRAGRGERSGRWRGH